ncbi:MAG: matrixin family metalloprotease, partial [Dehalococcoidia bacterium]|nr:matrixin family metalloprotease [Dehalococcoidia bacterium]
NDSSSNTIYRDEIPRLWTGCKSRDIACTAIWSGPPDYHITEAMMVFNEDYNDEFETSDLNCSLDRGYDVQTVALHEFGHFVGHPSHSSSSGDAMHKNVGDCKRTPSSNDIRNINAHYVGH